MTYLVPSGKAPAGRNFRINWEGLRGRRGGHGFNLGHLKGLQPREGLVIDPHLAGEMAIYGLKTTDVQSQLGPVVRDRRQEMVWIIRQAKASGGEISQELLDRLVRGGKENSLFRCLGAHNRLVFFNALNVEAADYLAAKLGEVLYPTELLLLFRDSGYAHSLAVFRHAESALRQSLFDSLLEIHQPTFCRLVMDAQSQRPLKDFEGSELFSVISRIYTETTAQVQFSAASAQSVRAHFIGLYNTGVIDSFLHDRESRTTVLALNILGLNAASTFAEQKARLRALVTIVHPDKWGVQDPKAASIAHDAFACLMAVSEYLSLGRS